MSATAFWLVVFRRGGKMIDCLAEAYRYVDMTNLSSVIILAASALMTNQAHKPGDLMERILCRGTGEILQTP